MDKQQLDNIKMMEGFSISEFFGFGGMENNVSISNNLQTLTSCIKQMQLVGCEVEIDDTDAHLAFKGQTFSIFEYTTEEAMFQAILKFMEWFEADLEERKYFTQNALDLIASGIANSDNTTIELGEHLLGSNPSKVYLPLWVDFTHEYNKTFKCYPLKIHKNSKVRIKTLLRIKDTKGVKLSKGERNPEGVQVTTLEFRPKKMGRLPDRVFTQPRKDSVTMYGIQQYVYGKGVNLDWETLDKYTLEVDILFPKTYNEVAKELLSKLDNNLHRDIRASLERYIAEGGQVPNILKNVSRTPKYIYYQREFSKGLVNPLEEKWNRKKVLEGLKTNEKVSFCLCNGNGWEREFKVEGDYAAFWIVNNEGNTRQYRHFIILNDKVAVLNKYTATY